MLLALPQETLLHICTSCIIHATIPCRLTCLPVSFLDIPDLAALSRASKALALLTADPVLHRTRLRVVAPSRVRHSLFGRSPEGILLRPTIPELVHRGVMRGLQIERRLRTGAYLYSPHASVAGYPLPPTHHSCFITGCKAVREYSAYSADPHQDLAVFLSPHSAVPSHRAQTPPLLTCLAGYRIFDTLRLPLPLAGGTQAEMEHSEGQHVQGRPGARFWRNRPG